MIARPSNANRFALNAGPLLMRRLRLSACGVTAAKPQAAYGCGSDNVTGTPGCDSTPKTG